MIKEKERIHLTYANYSKNKYRIAIWSPDKHTSIPHFHIIDNETEGSRVNIAINLEDGKISDSHNNKVPKNYNHIVSMIEKQLVIIPNNCYQTRLEFITDTWNMYNTKIISKVNKQFKIERL